MKINEFADKLKLPSINVGDEVRVGKFKNRKAEVTGFDKDEHNQPVLKTTKGDQKLFKPRISKLMNKDESVNENVSALATELEKKYNLKSLFISDMVSRNAFELSSIIVNKEDQGSGTGSKVMQELIAYADANEKIIVLDPGLMDKKHGTTSQSRLRKFYKKFGFIDNKGRNKNYEFRNLMIRYPQTNEAVNEVSKEEFDAIQKGYVDIEFDKKWWPLDDDYPLIKHIGKAIGATSWTSWGKVGVPWSTTEMIGGGGTYMLKGDFGHVLLDATKSFRPEQILMAQISTSNRGGGVGVKVMNAIKSYADQKGLPLTIYKVTNKKFFDKFEWLTKTGADTYEYNSSKVEEGRVNEGYKLQLERDADMMVLNITDTATGKRTEVRGKAGYETNGYDSSDRLHKLLDKIGKTANVSELINGEVVTINPNHPQGNTAKAATHTAFNESLDNPYPFKLTGPSESHGFVATAQTPNGLLRMDFKDDNYDEFSIDFAVDNRMGKTDAGDQFRVFATVVAIMKKWINTVGIEHVVSFDFAADKVDHASDGRAKLYARFAKQLASQLGWRLTQDDTVAQGKVSYFTLTNPKPVPRDDDYWDALDENFTTNAATDKVYNESLDNPYPVRWSIQNDNEWYGHAKEDDFYNQMGIEIKDGNDSGRWNIRFKVGEKMDKTGEGDQFKIFATVKAAIQEWWKWASKNTEVNQITFSAEKIVDSSRSKLYHRFAQQFARAIGYEMKVKPGRTADIFYIEKPGLEENFEQGVAEGRVQYKEIEFVCANPEFCDATDPVKQRQLYKALTKIPGVIALYQDQSEYSEGQMSLSAIFKDPQVKKQILQTAKQFGVAVDLEQPVDDDYVDRAIRGEHYGQIQSVAENFADGKVKGKSRPGRVKRAGASCNGSVTELRKRAKNSSGEKAKMLHWCGNMKAGRQKKKGK